MTVRIKNQNRLGVLFFALSFLTMALVSCDKNQSNQPVPTISSVKINGNDYPTTAIANQVWTIVNYNGAGGIAYKHGTEKPEYGRYYTFEEAKAVVLPDGWRLPTMQDYITLAESQGVVFTNKRATAQQASKKLASTTNWRSIRGDNSSGFNAQPAGYGYETIEPIDGDICEFWMADGNTFSLQEGASGNAHTIMFYGTNGPGYRFNLRFVRDK